MTPEHEALLKEWEKHLQTQIYGVFALSPEAFTAEAPLTYEKLRETIAEARRCMYPSWLGPCCERDWNSDGNCDIHSAPGVLRIPAPVTFGMLYGMSVKNLSYPSFRGTPEQARTLLDKHARLFSRNPMRGWADTSRFRVYRNRAEMAAKLFGRVSSTKSSLPKEEV